MTRTASSRADSRVSGRSPSRRSGRSSALDYADLGPLEAQGEETNPQTSLADDEGADAEEDLSEFTKGSGEWFAGNITGMRDAGVLATRDKYRHKEIRALKSNLIL